MKWRKGAAVLLAAVMAIGAVGCGSKEEGTDSAESGGGDTFKVGAFLQLTGANSLAGNEAKNTMELMIEYINENGGFNGKDLELVCYDSQGSPEEAVKIAAKLTQNDKVDAIIGSVNSSEILAAGRTINSAKTLMIGLGTSETWMAEDWPYVFRASANNATLAPYTVEMMDEIGFTNVAIFNGQDDASLSTAEAFIEKCEESKIEVLVRESYDVGDTDYSAQVANIVKADPQCVYMTVSGNDIGAFVKQLRNGGYNGIIFSKETWSMRDDGIAGVENSRYVAYAYPYVVYASLEDCDDEAIKEVLQMYVDKYEEMPTTEVPYRVYDSMMVMWEAAKIAGSNDPEAMKEAMTSVKIEGLGGQLDYSDGSREGYHSTNKYIYLGEGKNMEWTQWIAEQYDTFKSDTGREY